MSGPAASLPGKRARQRPPLRWMRHIRRGSVEAARLYWERADRARRAGLWHAPDHERYGFDREPSPPDKVSRERAELWHQHRRRLDREAFAKLPERQRAEMYWSAYDRWTVGWAGRPDAYVFGYDEFPERPADIPEPDWVQDMLRRLREASGTVDSPFAVLGLPDDATADDVRRAYRRLVATERAHPDHGADGKRFLQLTAARDAALAYAGAAR